MRPGSSVSSSELETDGGGGRGPLAFPSIRDGTSEAVALLSARRDGGVDAEDQLQLKKERYSI